MSRWIALMILAALSALRFPVGAQAADLRASNDSSLVLRLQMANQDGGPPRILAPGSWEVVEPAVSKGRHRITIDYWSGRDWVPLYDGKHDFFSTGRVIQLWDCSDGSLALAWWDSPPDCQERPPHLHTRPTTCLSPSGWSPQNASRSAVRVGLISVLGS
jgi:hypothetical protein